MNTEDKDPNEEFVESVQTEEQSEIESHLSFADHPGAEESPGQTQVEKLLAQLQGAEERAARSQAELDNFRKRTRREMEEREKFASLGLMSDLLLVVDNLELAIQAAEGDSEEASLLEGVQMVREQLLATLNKFQCKKIEAIGQLFDPNLHEAVQMQPHDETPANHVAIEVRAGYMVYDRVIRPSQVFVSTGKPE